MLDLGTNGHPRMDYVFNPDEAYSINLDFDGAVELIKELSKEQDNPIDQRIIIIEIPEGVFIRAQSIGWCRLLTGMGKTDIEGFDIKIIGVSKWTELTVKYRAPINLFGDPRLVRWRVGF